MVKMGMLIADRYEIVDKVGTGGMSDVYKAKDHKLNRFVAIKVLKQEFAENASFVSKFRVEAQAAAGLMHPNIVNVYDVGEEKGLYYIVMELVDGITLKKYIEESTPFSQRGCQHCDPGLNGSRGSTQQSHHTQGYKTAEYHYFQGRQGKGHGFRHSEGRYQQYNNKQRNGIGTLHIA